MNSDEKFWVCVWSLAASVVIALIVACTLSSINTSKVIERLVAGGADPMKVSCALDNSGCNKATCAFVATK